MLNWAEHEIYPTRTNERTNYTDERTIKNEQDFKIYKQD